MPIARVKDIDMHYEIHGEGPPLLLVAGLGGEGSYWTRHLPALSQRYSVILHDQRGTGKSSRPEMAYSVDMLADDLVQLMAVLGIDRAHYVGHSTGGAIGQIIAIQHPDRLGGMVQHSSWAKTDDHFRWCFEARLRLLRNCSRAEYMHASMTYIYPPSHFRDNAAQIKLNIATGLANQPSLSIAEARIEAILAHDQRDRLGEITTPTLVYCAKDDALTAFYHSEEIARGIPNATLRFEESGGHGFSQLYPDAFNRTVLEFLDAVQDQLPLEPLSWKH